MYITKLKILNFKKFSDRLFDFNDDINILVGDNESGKSTILEAIEIGLNCSYRGKPLSSIITTDLFNTNAIKKYLESDKSKQHLPEICIELFLKDLPEYRGDNNSLGQNTDGISLKVKFDNELQPAYEEFVESSENIKTIPIEFYTIEWFDFSWNKIKYLNKKVKGLFVDPTKLHPTYGKNQYISKIINTTLPKDQQALLNLNYRQLKELFNEQPQVKDINKQLDADDIVTDKKLEIVANVPSTNNFETGLQLSVDSINFSLIGKGEQNKIQIKLAIQNKAENIDVIMFEEPENHLSHINLAKLIKYIEEQRSEKQLFITTHSSYVLNKLSLNKLCLIANKYRRIKDIDSKVVKRLKRLPGYDTLRAVLSNKVILVEGPSDELILKKKYLDNYNRLPEEDGIDIIVVRGIGFENYIEIAKHTRINLHVVKDNDGNYEKNIKNYDDKYKDYECIEFYSSDKKYLYSLEPAMIDANAIDEKELDIYAEVTLSTQTFAKFKAEVDLDKKISFLKNWYDDVGGAGKKKVDSAMRIFETDRKIKYPDFLEKVFDFG